MLDLATVPRPLRMVRILDSWERGRIDGAELNRLLARWWIDTENPAQYGYRRLVRAFEAAGFVTDTTDLLPPTEPLTIYRGSANRGGISWTTDIERARFFAKRAGLYAAAETGIACGYVWTCTAEPSDVLARFSGRDENEVVINPAGIRCAILETFAPA